MSDKEDTTVCEKPEDEHMIKYIHELSKEINIEGTCGIVGNELELITLVRNCHFLYDKSLPDFKDVRKKNVAWSAIASVMHCKVQEVQQRWRSLREGYNRYKKDIELIENVNNGSIRPWEYYEEMKFIEPYIVHRRASSSKNTNTSYSTDIEGDMSSDAIDTNHNDSTSDLLRLILSIKSRSILYDSKHPNYKVKELKTDAWNEVAQETVLSVNDCEQKWKNLRERYGRERKLKHIQNDRKSWEYFEVLNFLDCHVKSRRHSFFRPILPKLEDNTNNLAIISPLNSHTSSNNQTVILKQLIKNISPIQDVEPKQGSPLINLQTHYDLQHVEFVDASNTSRSRSATPTQSDSKVQYKSAFVNSADQSHIILHDEDDLFGQTISAELRRIPSGKKKMKIKAEIYKILYENESDN